MTIVYVVTEGSYSDKRNVAVFSKEEDAESFVKQISEGRRFPDANIEEFELDGEPEENYKPKAPRWFVEFHPSSADIINFYLSEFYGDEDRGVQGGYFWTYVNTPDQETAAKIAMERRSIYLANHSGEVAE